jgi:hypothetical protein
MKMKIKHRIYLLTFVICHFNSYAFANPQYYWLLRIDGHLNLFIKGFVEIIRRGDHYDSMLHYMNNDLLTFYKDSSRNSVNVPSVTSTPLSHPGSSTWVSVSMYDSYPRRALDFTRSFQEGRWSTWSDSVKIPSSAIWLSTALHYNPSGSADSRNLMTALTSPNENYIHQSSWKGQNDTSIGHLLHLLTIEEQQGYNSYQLFTMPSIEAYAVYYTSSANYWVLVPHHIMMALAVLHPGLGCNFNIFRSKH